MSSSSNYSFPNGFGHWLDTYTLLAMQFSRHEFMDEMDLLESKEGLPIGVLQFLKSNPDQGCVQDFLQSATDVFEASYPAVVFETPGMMVYDPVHWFEEITASPDFYVFWRLHKRFPLPDGKLKVVKNAGVESSRPYAIVDTRKSLSKAVAYFDDRQTAVLCMDAIKAHRLPNIANLMLYGGYGKA